MHSKKLFLTWTDGRSVDISLLDNPASNYYYYCIKHLQYLDLEFNSRKNPLHQDRKNLPLLYEQIAQVAEKLNVGIEIPQLEDQKYLNELHNEYFNSTDGRGCNDPVWLQFHDLIHLIEDARQYYDYEAIWFDYENRAGRFVEPFDQSWLQYAVYKVPVGLCYLQALELGKTVKKYIRDQESFDLENMCKIMKPWIDLKPTMHLSVVEQDREIGLKKFKEQYGKQFEHWQNNFQKDWMKFWKLEDWTILNESAALPIGYVKDIETVLQCFKNHDYPNRITY